MLNKFLGALGMGGKRSGAASAKTSKPTSYAPYVLDAANTFYNLVFCDDVEPFLAKPGRPPVYWQTTLGAEPADVAALRALAEDPAQEGRLRYLAYARLRGAGQTVPAKQLFGVIVEVPLQGGLDTLAAYAGGSVRYINQSGKMSIAEGVPALAADVQALFAAAQPLIDDIGPWTEPRLAPPAQGQVRLSFLVSDGLYFGQGPMQVLQRDAIAGPVFDAATSLLKAVVAMSVKGE